ncbi:MAG: PQQ-like beta-propeller repeat protein [Bacteroidales bacterium]|nr:PQQ-like beta-propeller repeat protein [Bacteroidales bacterium]
MIKYTYPAFIFFMLLSCSSAHQDIYEWRGENRSGIYPDTDLLGEWPIEGPEELWTVNNLGRGYGSALFVEDHFYITGAVDSLALLYCFNLEGKKLWQTSLGMEWVTSFPGSRSAPTVVDDLLYIGTGMGNLLCVNREDGIIVWSRDFADDFQGQYPLHGHSEAAVVKDDMVYWTPGGLTHNVVALDRFTGDLIWSNPGFGEYSAYNQGKLVSHLGQDIFVTFSAYHIMGFEAETGELLWSQEQFGVTLEERGLGYGDTHANSVIYNNGAIFFAAGDGNRGVRLDLSEDGSEITEAWRNTGFDGFMGGIVIIGNYLYSSGTSTQYLKSIDATTGILTDSLKIGHGAVIAADQMLYYYNQRGEMRLISFTEGKMKEISSFKIEKGTGHHFSHPVIYRGVLYQRRGDALMAFDIREVTL